MVFPPSGLVLETGTRASHIVPMDSNDIGRLLYLAVLGAAVGGYFVLSSRQNLGKLARDLSVWGLIFVGAIAGYGLWGDIVNDVVPRQTYIQDSGQVTVPQSPDGHYYLTLKIDDTPVRFVVDTGATEIVLSLQDAARVGIDVDGLAFMGRADTANGVVNTAAVKLAEVTLGPITDRNMPAAVNGGSMEGSLLGMRYLDRFESLEIRDDTLVLRR